MADHTEKAREMLAPYAMPDGVRCVLLLQIAALIEREEKMREALKSIKAHVCGDAHPRWSNFDAVTGSRYSIAEECDAALAPAQPAAPSQPVTITITPESMRQAVAASEAELPKYCDNCITPDACGVRGGCSHRAREAQPAAPSQPVEARDVSDEASKGKYAAQSLPPLEPVEAREPLSMSMFASRADYEAAATSRRLEAAEAREPLTRLQIEMDLWPALRLRGVQVTLIDLFAIVEAVSSHTGDAATSRRLEAAEGMARALKKIKTNTRHVTASQSSIARFSFIADLFLQLEADCDVALAAWEAAR